MAKILFVMRATTHFHYYRSIVEAVAKKGYETEVLFERLGEHWSEATYIEPVEEVKRRFSNFSYSQALNRKNWEVSLVKYSRMLLNYHHNLNFKDQPRFFRDRAISSYPVILKLPLKTSLGRFVIRQRLVGNFLRRMEKLVAPERSIILHLKKINPAVLVAPAGNLIGNSADIEYTKAAAALGIKTVIPVISWDFLTTKGTIHVMPDLLLVWNKFHEDEALRYHHFPKAQIRIIGAPLFDKWLSIINKKPKLDRESFSRKYGLKPENYFVIYLGSTANVAADESWVVREMRKELDDSGNPDLKNVQIIVRPHPAHWKIYESLKNLKNIRIIPEVGGVMPDNETSLSIFYETLYHSVVASGINTSGMIDAMVAGKPLITMLVERYRSRQEKTAYFQQLLESDSSYLAKNGNEFAKILKELLQKKDSKKIKRDAFISDAIRPRGLDISAGEAAALEIENLLKSK